MSRNTTLKPILAIILAFLVALNGTACGILKKPTPKQEKSSSQSDSKKPPKELDQLKKSIDKIETALMAIHEKSKTPMFIQQQEQQAKQQAGAKTGGGGGGGSTEGGGSSGSEGSQGSGGGGGSSSGSGGGGGAQAQPSPMPTMSPAEVKAKLEADNFKAFESLKKDTKTLHSAWNSYEPTAVSDLAKPNIMKEFEDTLATLTKSIESHDDYLALLDVNQLNKYLPEFYELYKSETPPDLDKVKFALKKIKLVNEKKDFETEKSVLNYLNDVWTVLKPKLKKDNMDMINKFEFALADLKKAVEDQNNTLVDAKSDVMIELVSSAQKKMKE